MKADQPVVSIIIVNTNDEKFLIPCIESIHKFEPLLAKEIIVIDNHSSNDIQNLIADKFSNINVIKLDYNAGFCKANNIGLKNAKGKYVLLLNPDTLLISDAVTKCIEYFAANFGKLIGSVGCRLLNADGSLQKSFYWGASSISKTLEWNPLYFKLFGNKFKAKHLLRENQLHASTSQVDWLCGAFLLMDRNTVDKEGFYLEEDFFLYSDDVELGYAMRKKKYSVNYFPQVSIIHLGGGNKNVSLKKFEQITISDWLCNMKIHGKIYFVLNQLLILSNLLLNEILFRKDYMFGKIRIINLRDKVFRKKISKLLWRYTFIILFRFKKNYSSGKMLKYHAE